MKIFPMRYFLLSNFFFIVFGCGRPLYKNLQTTTANPDCLSKFKPDFSSVLYYALINVVGNHLNGLLLFKKMQDNTTRVVFTNEAGVKFFDFEYTDLGFKVVYCIKQLNKKAVINQLKKDIGLTFLNGINIPSAKIFHSEKENYFGFFSGKEQTYFITDSDCSRLLRIENTSKRKKKIIVNLSDYKNGMADSIYIAHQLFEFNISLKQLER